MAAQNRMMTLVAFLQAQNCSNLPGSWRHPATMLDFLTPEYYQRIARTLEDGKIQMAFFDDRLALPDLYTGHHAPSVGAGVRAVKLDPATVLMTMGMATTRLGLAFAAKWAEIVFVIYHGLEHGKEQYALFKEAVAAAGRDPALVSVAPACYVCVGESEGAAQEKRAVIEATAREVDALVLLSE